MLQPIFKKLKGKHMTTGLIESKNHQIKHTSGDRKQQDSNYNHELFALSNFIVEKEYLPIINIYGRPLFKFLMKEPKSEGLKYVISKNKQKIIQMTLPVV
jgi:hypothetical protein